MAGGQSIQPPEEREWWEVDFTLNPDILDGYPSFAVLGNFNDNTMDSKYNLTMHVDDLDGYPSLRLGKINDDTLESHYIFKLGRHNRLEGYPYLEDIDVDVINDFLVYSKYIFCHQYQPEYIEGYPTLGKQEFEMFGCGRNSTINELVIPPSVYFISDYAFYECDITSVKINRHCIYYPHSFPPGCHIKPYNDV